MKKSYLILLLCFLFCGQMFGQKPIPVKPNTSKNPAAPVITSPAFDPPVDPPQPCEGVGYEIMVDTIVWDTDSVGLAEMIPSFYMPDDLPELFNVVQLSLNHPVGFQVYDFDISVVQSGSSNPVLVLFINQNALINPIYDDMTGLCTGFRVVKWTNGGGGVVTTASMENIWDNKQKCIRVSTEGKTVTLEDGIVCSLNDSLPPQICEEFASESSKH